MTESQILAKKKIRLGKMKKEMEDAVSATSSSRYLSLFPFSLLFVLFLSAFSLLDLVAPAVLLPLE